MQNNREIKAPADEIKLELKTARPTMRLNEQAFRRPPENPDDEKKRQAYLDTVYGDKLAKRDVKKDYEEMVLALCRALHETIGKKNLDVGEHISVLANLDNPDPHVTNFVKHFVQMVDTAPEASDYPQIIEEFEKILYLLNKELDEKAMKEQIAKRNQLKPLSADEIQAQFAKAAEQIRRYKQTAMQTLLPNMIVCASGTLMHFKNARRIASGGETADDLWCDQRTDAFEQYATLHKKQFNIPEGNGAHVDIVLNLFAEQERFGLRYVFNENYEDRFANTAEITPLIKAQIKTQFLTDYQLRSMADKLAQHFEKLWLRSR